MIRVGLVGVGFMGWIHYLAWRKVNGASLTAFASRDPAKRSGDWRTIKGNFGPPGEQIDVSGMSVYATLEALLANPDIDLIDICLPPHGHPEAIEKALRAGKHVLCEKPLALHADEARRLMGIARETGRQLMVAQVLPFMPEFAFLVAVHRAERYGRLITARYRRVIGPPDWIPDFYDVNAIGGPLVDLHVHDAHLMRLMFGMPVAVTTRARMHQGVPKFIESLFDFADGRFAAATCGVTDTPGRPFGHGYEVQFEHATLQFDFTALQDGVELQPLKILHRDGTIERPALSSSDPVDAFASELGAAANMAAGLHEEPILDGQLAADALVICQAQAKAAQSGAREFI